MSELTDNIVRAVNLVNEWRELHGLEPLDDLPQGVSGSPVRCILARAFNFDCEIFPSRGLQSSEAIFTNAAHAEEFARLVG